MLPLKDRDLLRQAMLIDGAWVQADNGRTLDVRNPRMASSSRVFLTALQRRGERSVPLRERCDPPLLARCTASRAAILR
jgi:succinate-semialdehyde dehydrogenase/glutarate-semialdehyde dehydrogenase